MHTAEMGAGRNNVPAFLTKLWKLVEDAKYNELIYWSENGLSFIIKDQARFAKEVLPMYFKHSNMASFIRQLNMYGFHKLVKIEQGGLHYESDEMEFFHQYFIKGQQSLLEFIKRKQVTKDDARVETVKSLMTDVKNLQGKQDNVDNLMASMKRENEALWREVAFLRQKHLKQQQIVEKLIQFLVTLVQPNVNMSVKRKLPLMINNTSSDSKIQRLSRKSTDFHFGTNREETQKGPVIHDVTDLMDRNDVPEDDVIGGATNTYTQNPSTSDIDHPLIQSPAAAVNLENPHHIPMASPLGDMEVLEPLSILEPLQPTVPLSPSGMCDEGLSVNVMDSDPSLVSLQTPLIPMNLNDPLEFTMEHSKDDTDNKTSVDESLMQVALAEPSTSKDPVNKASVITDHLNTIESELDWLQEQLSGNTLNIDASTLLGVRGCWDSPTAFKLFGSDDSLLGNNLSSESLRLSGGEITGNELIQYAPSLLDMVTNDEEFNLGSTDGDKQAEPTQSSDNPDLEKIMLGLLNEKST